MTEVDDLLRSKILKKRMLELQLQKKKTSNGEPISWAAIGRCCDPPVSSTAVYLVRDGIQRSARITRTIEQELGQRFWMREAA